MEPLPKKNEGYEGDDRLSNLPDAILHYIFLLSDLQIFDLVELGVMSKRWNSLWITMPYLDIHLQDFLEYLDSVHPKPTVREFISFVDFVLSRGGQSSLVRFTMSCSLTLHETEILRWLRLVIERNVQELDVKFIPLGSRFSLPLFIAVNDSLRLLKIVMNGNDVMQVPSAVRLNQLRSLELNDIVFPDSDTLQRIFSGCSSLESFRLNDCGFQRFDFLEFSSTNLKELILCFEIEYSGRVPNFEIKVSCPNLISFIYSPPLGTNIIIENVSSLETAWIVVNELHSEFGHRVHNILKEVHNVTSLNCGLFVVLNLSEVIDELIRCPTSFPKLKFLSLGIATVRYQARVLFHLLDHCPNLEVLTLDAEDGEDEPDDEDWELLCEGIVSWKSHPHLKTIKFVDFTGKDYELDFLGFLLKNAKSLERMDIICQNISVEIIDKVLMFPKASSGTVVTFIDN